MATVTSDTSATVETTATINDWRLKAVKNPSLNMILSVEQDSLDITYNKDAAEFKPLGRKYPLMVEDVIRAALFQLNIGTLGNEEYQQLKAIYEYQDTLLLQSPMESGEQWYVRIDSPIKERIENTTDEWRHITLNFVEVEPPPVE